MSRKCFICLLLLILAPPLLARSQEGVFLNEEEAPKAVFPDATDFVRKIVPATAELREKIKEQMGKAKSSIWENSYTTFIAKRDGTVLGYAVIIEEIGKHRPITFVVGAGTDGKVIDAAVMVYREPYGGEVKERRFLSQYEGKELKDPLLPYRDIRNITGATLSVEAIGRGIKKTLALVRVLYLSGGTKK